MKRKTKIKPNRPIAVHPGKVLQSILDDNEISQSELSRHLKMPQSKINEICRGKRGVSAEMAYKLARVFNSSPEFWLNLQREWELKEFDENDFCHITPLKIRA
ncbi:HigA family addiction module antidote protein [bacterium]|nr:HigA family addiction module antidote protein [bacterium]